ncbi:MAG: alkaline phosphatase family protein [Acidimicrobiia bacterium]
MNRRDFLRVAAGAGLSALGTVDAFRATDAVAAALTAGPTHAPDSVLHHAAADCPIDTVVIVMMENRSFDHYLGWLADDHAYLDAGRRRYGAGFRVDGRVRQTYPDASGRRTATRPASSYEPEKAETRGCGFRDPGHSWTRARIQRDHGFLAKGTGNDTFALAYYQAADLPIYAALARRFTVFDRWHSSILGPTFPNRQYLLSAQSEGRKADTGGLPAGLFHAETIVDRLAAAQVPVGYYHTNVPLLALWGLDRMAPYIRSLDRYFDDAVTGRLPNVSFVEPQFGGGDLLRTDDHPRGDVGLGQRWIRDVFHAFATSPQWRRGAFIVVYDEGGGFFDHVRPPTFPDARASTQDRNNFGQGGFRVPALLASPYGRPGAVDHRRYDHTAIIRFLEWRFLGAPPEGAGRHARWSLTLRDRTANNMGRSLRASRPDPELGFDLAMPIPPPAPACTAAQLASHLPDRDPDPFDRPELTDLATRFPGATYKPWLADVALP